MIAPLPLIPETRLSSIRMLFEPPLKKIAGLDMVLTTGSWIQQFLTTLLRSATQSTQALSIEPENSHPSR